MGNYRSIILVLLLLAIPAAAAKIKNGEDLVAAMHKRYSGKWYKTLTFVQKNTQYSPDGTTRNSTWYEAMSLPGNLRIDFDPLETKSGMLFAGGSQSTFKDGKPTGTRARLHPLMVLGFDVYRQPVDDTVAQLKKLKFNLSVLRKDMWRERPVYVVGAKAGDLKTAQFWIDREYLYFVRMMQPAGPDGKQVRETRFNKYLRMPGGGWVAPEVVFSVDGKRVFLEEYTEIRTGTALPEDLFDPAKWVDADRTYFKKKH